MTNLLLFNQIKWSMCIFIFVRRSIWTSQ